MPTSLKAKKRVRQNEKHRSRHKARKSELKTLVKKFKTDLGDKLVKEAEADFGELQTKLDKAAAFHTLHRNTVARKKSRMQRKLNMAKKAGGAAAAPEKK